MSLVQAFPTRSVRGPCAGPQGSKLCSWQVSCPPTLNTAYCLAPPSALPPPPTQVLLLGQDPQLALFLLPAELCGHCVAASTLTVTRWVPTCCPTLSSFPSAISRKFTLDLTCPSTEKTAPLLHLNLTGCLPQALIFC